MISEERISAAADWFIRMRSEEVRAEDLLELSKWLQAHPDNAAAYHRVCASWSAVGKLASAPEIMIGRRDALDHARRANERRWASPRNSRRWQALAAGFAGLCVAAFLAMWIISQPGDVYETTVGERRILTLTDGSVVKLDAASRIRVTYGNETRAVTMESGQASFQVAKDSARPFRVNTELEAVIALGTEFNVDMVADTVVVTMIEGRVKVVPHPGESGGSAVSAFPRPRAGAIELVAGQQLVSADGHPGEIRSNVDVTRVVAWQNGKLVFDDEPLSSAAERMNRYALPRIEVDPSADHIHISGTFNAQDSDAFIEAISSYFPITAAKTRAGTIRLTAQPGTAASSGNESPSPTPSGNSL